MSLSFHEPSVEGSNIVVSPLLEVELLGTKKWELCLVGRFLDTKLPTTVVSSITRKLWMKQGVLDVIPHGKGVYIFRFSQPSGAKDVQKEDHGLLLEDTYV